MPLDAIDEGPMPEGGKHSGELLSSLCRLQCLPTHDSSSNGRGQRLLVGLVSDGVLQLLKRELIIAGAAFLQLRPAGTRRYRNDP